jgi:hypothetical protein
MNWNQSDKASLEERISLERMRNVSYRPWRFSPSETIAVRDEAARQLQESRQKAHEVATLCARASRVGRMNPLPRTSAFSTNSSTNQQTPRF